MALTERLAYVLSADTTNATTGFRKVEQSAQAAAVAQSKLQVAADRVAVAEARAAQVAAKAAGDTAGLTAATNQLTAARQRLAGSRAESSLVQARAGFADAQKGVTGLSTATTGLTASLSRFGVTGPQAAAVGAVAVGKFMLDAKDAASNLQEQISASEAIFGPAAATVQEFAKTAADSFGLSERAALQYANSFAVLFQNAGVNQQKAADFSVTLTKLAADIASLRNIAQEDVLVGLRSSLTGEVEPARRLGVLLNDVAVTQRAVALGMADANGKVDDGAKVLARLNIILEQTKTAQGDYARTSESAANAQRTLSAQFENFQAALGKTVTPAVAEVTGALGDMLNAVNKITGPLGGLGNILGKISVSPFYGLITSLVKTKDAAGDAEKAQADYAQTMEDVATAQRVATAETDRNTKALEAAERAALGLRSAQERLSDVRLSGQRSARSLAQTEDELNELLDEGAVDAEKLARANEKLASSSDGVTRAQRDEVEAARDLAAAHASVVEIQKELDELRKGTPADKLRQAELDVADALDEQTRSALDLAAAKEKANSLKSVGMLGVGDTVAEGQDLARSQLEVSSATRQLERSSFAAKDAQAELTRLQNVGKEGSKELKAVQDKLADAQDVVRDRTQKVADAHTNVAKAQQDEIAAGVELAKAQEGDPEFAERVAAARQGVADAHEATARQKRDERDATEALLKAEQELNKERAAKAANDARILAEQLALGPIGRAAPWADTAPDRTATMAHPSNRPSPQVFDPLGRTAGPPTIINNNIYSGADPNAVTRALEQWASRNGGSPRK